MKMCARGLVVLRFMLLLVCWPNRVDAAAFVFSTSITYPSRHNYHHHWIFPSSQPNHNNHHVPPLEAVPPLDEEIRVREWREGEGDDILDLLLLTLRKSNNSDAFADDAVFEPEGSLDSDCGTESLLKESYNEEDGGCFLVAELVGSSTTTTRKKLVGTAGLIVGTPVQYYASGASQSAPDITAALRRCCGCIASTTTITTTSSVVLKQLITAVEQRAIRAGAAHIIALAYYYPASSSREQNGSTSIAMMKQRPSPQLLEELGYEVSKTQLPGVTARQYGKELL